MSDASMSPIYLAYHQDMPTRTYRTRTEKYHCACRNSKHRDSDANNQPDERGLTYLLTSSPPLNKYRTSALIFELDLW